MVFKRNMLILSMPTLYWVNLSKKKRRMGISRAGRAAPRNFPRAKPMAIPEEQPCQPKENPVLPDSFNQIYIIFLIGFRIGPPIMHRHIGPPESVLALLNPYWPS